MKKASILLVFVLTLCSCQKVDLDITNLNGNKISVLGHGGMGIAHTFPINSYESILYALNLGADGTELDVEMTRDSVLVAFHDLELSVKTNLYGKIYEKTWDELRTGRYIYPAMTNYKIINLDMLFSGLGGLSSKIFFFDCKNYNPDTSETYRNTFCRAVLKIIDRYGLQDNILVEVKREDIIKTFKELRPELKVFVYSDYNSCIRLARQYQLQGLVIDVDNISKEQVKFAHDNGLQVAVLNANSPRRNREAIEKHVDFIESDNLKYLLKLLK